MVLLRWDDVALVKTELALSYLLPARSLQALLISAHNCAACTKTRPNSACLPEG